MIDLQPDPSKQKGFSFAVTRFLILIYKRLYITNSFFMTIGKQIAWVALAMMVFVILLGVFFRYVLNDALPWPDEAARFCMLWMTALVAPLALRSGGFVAIDMLSSFLPRRIEFLLKVFIFVLAAIVLFFGLRIGWKHTMGFGGNFDSSSLKVPLSLIGMESFKMKLRYMYASLLIGVSLLFLVSIELIIQSIIQFLSPRTRFDKYSNSEILDPE